MLVNFTIETVKVCKNNYTMSFRTDVIPTVGSTVCFPCDADGGQRGYYFKVENVIYYPLKRGSVVEVMDGNMTAQVILHATYRDLTHLVSPKNTMNPGEWKKRPKEVEAA